METPQHGNASKYCLVDDLANIKTSYLTNWQYNFRKIVSEISSFEGSPVYFLKVAGNVPNRFWGTVLTQKEMKTPIKAKTVIFYFKPDTNEN